MDKMFSLQAVHLVKTDCKNARFLLCIHQKDSSLAERLGKMTPKIHFKLKKKKSSYDYKPMYLNMSYPVEK